MKVVLSLKVTSAAGPRSFTPVRWALPPLVAALCHVYHHVHFPKSPESCWSQVNRRFREGSMPPVFVRSLAACPRGTQWACPPWWSPGSSSRAGRKALPRWHGPQVAGWRPLPSLPDSETLAVSTPPASNLPRGPNSARCLPGPAPCATSSGFYAHFYGLTVVKIWGSHSQQVLLTECPVLRGGPPSPGP